MFLGNTPNEQAGLFGLKHSNRDFTQKEAWGKNCFNSSFPASLCSYLHSQNFDNIYINLNSNLKVEHSSISTDIFYGINPNSDNLFYAFEAQFTPYQQYLIGNLPGVDLVIQARDLGACLQAIEIKLTKLEINEFGGVRAISRHTRTSIWLFRMLYDFSISSSFNHRIIIDTLSYNTKNDKAFAVSGRVTRAYMRSEALRRPRIQKQEIKRIILGGGQYLLSPERRFDAIISNSPGLFD